jgi:hypothetical protein
MRCLPLACIAVRVRSWGALCATHTVSAHTDCSPSRGAEAHSTGRSFIPTSAQRCAASDSRSLGTRLVAVRGRCLAERQQHRVPPQQPSRAQRQWRPVQLPVMPRQPQRRASPTSRACPARCVAGAPCASPFCAPAVQTCSALTCCHWTAVQTTMALRQL